jgi:hypothetical protein
MPNLNVPNPFDAVYLRKGRKGESYTGIKQGPWHVLKRDRQDTTLFDDLVYAKSRLDAAVGVFMQHVKTMEEVPFEFGPEIWNVHPLLGSESMHKLIRNMQFESSQIPVVWRTIRQGTYVPPGSISTYYTNGQLMYEPPLKPDTVSLLHIDFMSAKDKAEYKYYENLKRLERDGIPESYMEEQAVVQAELGGEDDDDEDIVLEDFDDDEDES